MDKIRIKWSLKNEDVYVNLLKIEMKLNELTEGYNEIMKRLDKLEEQMLFKT